MSWVHLALSTQLPRSTMPAKILGGHGSQYNHSHSDADSVADQFAVAPVGSYAGYWGLSLWLSEKSVPHALLVEGRAVLVQAHARAGARRILPPVEELLDGSFQEDASQRFFAIIP